MLTFLFLLSLFLIAKNLLLFKNWLLALYRCVILSIFKRLQPAGADVKKYILSNTTKAVGSDDLSRDMLVLVLDLILPIITHIINYSLANKIFPANWKMAHVVSLPKSSNPSSLSHFRPISILPIPSKVIENAVFKQLS